jgi:TldD protein
VALRAVAFPSRGPAVGSYETPFVIDPFTVPLAEKLSALDGPVRALLGFGRPVQSAEASMEWTRLHKRMLSTEASDTRQSFMYGTCGMQVTAIDDAGHAQCRSYPVSQGGNAFQAGYERIAALDLMAHTARIAEEARDLLAAPPCPAGTTDVILESSQVALQIHESCGHPTELDRALGSEISLAGGSFLQPDMLGKFRYGAPIVDLVADSTTPTGLGTFGWDDEGTPAGKHPLIQRGMFVDYLSSRETAATLGRESTGTMRAEGYNRPPLIRMINVSLEPGTGTLEELIADTDDGIYVECDKSWSIDDLRLNFQFSCELAWEIKHGKRTRLLRDPLYTGITPRFWQGCDAIAGPSEWKLWGLSSCGKGDPIQMMHVAHGASPARFRGVTVGATGG